MKKTSKNVLTPADEAAFEKYMEKWRDMLNLSDWRVVRKPGHSPYMAEIFKMEPEHRLARYRIGKDFGDHPVNQDSLEDTARHELLHLFLYGLIHAVSEYGMDSDEVLAEEHRIITVLGRLLNPWLHSRTDASKA